MILLKLSACQVKIVPNVFCDVHRYACLLLVLFIVSGFGGIILQFTISAFLFLIFSLQCAISYSMIYNLWLLTDFVTACMLNDIQSYRLWIMIMNTMIFNFYIQQEVAWHCFVLNDLRIDNRTHLTTKDRRHDCWWW